MIAAVGVNVIADRGMSVKLDANGEAIPVDNGSMIADVRAKHEAAAGEKLSPSKLFFPMV